MNKYLSIINEKLAKPIQLIKRYRIVVFIIALALIYGFLVYRINTMSNQQPTDSDISAQLKASSSPHVDQTVIDKIQQLQDNSVQVKTLFNNARKNPFSE